MLDIGHISSTARGHDFGPSLDGDSGGIASAANVLERVIVKKTTASEIAGRGFQLVWMAYLFRPRQTM